MRAFLLLAAFVTLSLAQCSLYFDDCQACLSDNECGWCGDYCTSKDSAFCDVKMVHDVNLCPAPDSVQAAVKRSSAACNAHHDCESCNADTSCVFCLTRHKTGETYASVCTAKDQCASVYGSHVTYETQSPDCKGYQTPPGLPSSSSGPEPFILVFQGEHTNQDVVATAISTSFDEYYGNNPDKHIDPTQVDIIDLKLVQGSSLGRNVDEVLEEIKRQSTTNTRCDFEAVANHAYVGGQKQLNEDVTQWLKSLTLGTPISPGLVPVGKSGSTSGSSSSSNLSGGDLAAIIIACIIGAALIAAILLWVLLLRRKGSHPAPFRSPAAAFKP